MVLQTGKARQNKIFPLELYQWTYVVCIFTGKSPMAIPSVIVAWTINISELSAKYRQIHSVDDCGMGNNFFLTLCLIPMDLCRL
jgi:hypothetical protein